MPDDEFNEIFARLPSHRDRALVAFYVSTGARASELLSVTQGGVDPGRQVITVARKGSRRGAGAAGVDRTPSCGCGSTRWRPTGDPARGAAAAVVDAAPARRAR